MREKSYFELLEAVKFEYSRIKKNRIIIDLDGYDSLIIAINEASKSEKQRNMLITKYMPQKAYYGEIVATATISTTHKIIKHDSVPIDANIKASKIPANLFEIHHTQQVRAVLHDIHGNSLGQVGVPEKGLLVESNAAHPIEIQTAIKRQSRSDRLSPIWIDKYEYEDEIGRERYKLIADYPMR